MAKKSAPKLSQSQKKQWLTLLQPSAAPVGVGSRSSQRYRVVIDTNILISAILHGGKPELVVQHVLTRQHIVLSDYIIEEFVDYCKSVHPKVPRKWLRRLRQKLEVHSYDDGVDVDEVVRDINDTDILKLAIKQKAIIVTGDKDLLEHKSESRVAILSTIEYSQLFELL